jgi:hypothetical protein
VKLLAVAEVCARMRAANLDLFEQLGEWVLDTAPGAEQRRWATSCHRHAWHAALWAERAPAIRPFDLAAATSAVRGRVGAPLDAAERAAWYATAVARLVAELDGLAAQIDPELDPSTARTIALVRGDLAG